jgi:hypothetical protein
VPGGFYGNWHRRKRPQPVPTPEPPVADLTVLIARSRDGSFEAMVELVQMSGAENIRQLIELVSPTGAVTPFTFDLACRALEFVEMYPIKEKQA